MDEFDHAARDLEAALAECEPLSPRAHVVATMLRFVEAGRARQPQARPSGGSPR